MPAEFDCAECGMHVVAIMADEIPTIPLCCECIWLPGWTEDPVLVAMLAPERLKPPPWWRRLLDFLRSWALPIDGVPPRA